MRTSNDYTHRKTFFKIKDFKKSLFKMNLMKFQKKTDTDHCYIPFK